MRTWWITPSGMILDSGRPHLRARLDAIDKKLDRLLAGQTQLARAEGDVLMTLDDVIAKVTGLTDVETGLATAIDQLIAQDADLAQKLKDAIASADPAKVQAVADALDAQVATLGAKKQAVIDAVTANAV